MSAFVLAALGSTSCLVRINEKALWSENRKYSVKANGDLVTRTWQLDGTVRTYRLLGSGDFIFEQQDTDPYVEITASENIMPYFRPDLSLSDGALSCRFSSDSIGNIHQGYIKVVLHARDLERIEVAGSGDVLIEGLVRPGDFFVSVAGSGDIDVNGLECDNLKIAVAGSGDVSMDVKVRGKIDAGVAGSGDIRLIGSADRASFSVAGSGDIDARGLKVANDISSSTKGSGDIRL